MALVAGEARVLALENVSGVLVIEGLRVPFNQWEVAAVMLRVATGTFLVGTRCNVIRRVKAAPGGNAGGDLGVAFEALERSFTAATLVAVGAVGGAIQRDMRLRKRTRRNLCESRTHH